MGILNTGQPGTVSAAGTGSYAFCWVMAGNNADYRDVEMVARKDLR
jgi:4-deoxy-L-threo-5-hexosulose-uronate ketol-isomerase